MKQGNSLDKATLDKAFEDSRFSVKKFEQTQGGEDEAEEAEFSSYTATIAGMT